MEPKEKNWLMLKAAKEEYLQKHLSRDRVDSSLLPLLRLINSSPLYITSSSCSGRISLLCIKKGKKDASFYKKWHTIPPRSEFLSAILNYKEKKPLWLLCEPFILHLYCKDLGSADSFLKICRKAGIKRGGISSLSPHIFIEIIGTNSFSLPLYNKKLLVSREYLSHICLLCKRALAKNKKQLERLEKELQNI